jgi:hypothetical protein
MPHAATSAPRQCAAGASLHFTLDLNDDGPRIVARTGGDRPVTYAYGTDIQHILVPLESGTVRHVVALDVLEHAYDEQAFLAECARLTGEGGILRLRVPVDGLTGWLDAINMIRYLSETTGLAPEPMEPQPSGWHRHYREGDIVRLTTGAGFAISGTRRVNPGIAELPHAAGLIVGGVALKRPGTELAMFRLRQRIARIENALPAGPLGTRLEITARRA